MLGEQYFGAHATDRPLLVTAVYAPYVLMPLLLLWRVKDVPVFSPYKASSSAAKGAKQVGMASPAGQAGAKRRQASPRRPR